MVEKSPDDYPELKIEKTVNVLYDGHQYLVKFPKEMSEFFGIKKGYKCRLTVVIPEKGNKLLNSKAFFKLIRGKYEGGKKKKSGLKPIRKNDS